MPFGDSITDGVGSTDQAGYRTRLFELVVQANQKLTFVGSRSSGPAQIVRQSFPRNHEGHPGWTIDPGFVGRPLLDDIVATAPEALIVVAVPTPLSWNPASLQTYSQRIRSGTRPPTGSPPIAAGAERSAAQRRRRSGRGKRAQAKPSTHCGVGIKSL